MYYLYFSTPRFQHPKTSTPESGKSEKEYTATRKEKAPPIKSMIPKFAISSDDDNIITSPKGRLFSDLDIFASIGFGFKLVLKCRIKRHLSF